MFDQPYVIKLTDRDFSFMGNSNPKVIHPLFKGMDGYIMVYAEWCPNCQNKEVFWSHLAREFNSSPAYKKERFRIGVVNVDDPLARKFVTKMNVSAIPRFIHVTSTSDGSGTLSEYNGDDFTPEALMGEVCQTKGKLCNVKIDMS